MRFQAVRGFKDWLPEDTLKYNYLLERARLFLERANFKEIKLPILEKTELFIRSIGEVTDIVQKETYTFQDRNKDFLTLRPEATAGICRMVIEHGFHTKPKPLKFYTFGPMFRHERPQKGRLREFHQLDVEFFGNITPYYEVELLELALDILEAPLEGGFSPFTLEINSLGCPQCRPAYREYLKEALSEKGDGLCETCKERLSRNPLRVLDCKKDNCKEIVRSLKDISEFWCSDCKSHFEELTELLKMRGRAFEVNPYLVRGLDYYVRTIFEIKGKNLGAQDTVCAGGRYDYLLRELGGPDLQATGFAIGLERWSLCVFGEEGFPTFLKEKLIPEFIFLPLGERALKEGLGLVKKLREAGLRVEAIFEERSLKALLREADRLGAKKALILGDREMEEGVIVVRDLIQGEQRKISLEKLLEEIRGF